MSHDLPTAPAEASALESPARRPVNLRSLALGLAGVTFICTLTPYNNYVLANTDFVGNHLPASLLIFFLLFILTVNALLRVGRSPLAFTSGELAVSMGMTMVACALPSVGLMRYLPGHLVAFFNDASANSESAKLLRQLNLPDWLFPAFQQSDPAARGSEPVVADFVRRTVVAEHSFTARFLAVPWALWIRPALTWGAFFLALIGTVLSLTLVLRRQWVENEKVAFPLASVYASLIEEPKPGRAVNELLSSRLFWIAFISVFCLHGFNALSVYFPRTWPAIPLRYDFNAIFAEPPWSFTSFGFKSSRVLFTIIGIMFFVQGRTAFSVWFFYLAMQFVRMGYGLRQSEFTGGMVSDQLMGALVAMGAAILWVARRHLLQVGRAMFRGSTGSGRYLPDGAAGWALLISVTAMLTWLVLAGASITGAAVLVGVLLLMWIVLAKVVAETGLLYVLLPAPAERFWLYLGDLSGGGVRTTLRSIFFSNWFFGMLQHDTREALPVFATHATQVADHQAYAGERNWRRSFPFVAALLLALVVGFAVSGASSLYIHYSYSTTLDQREEVVGSWGSFDLPREAGLGMTKHHIPPRSGPSESHSRVGHFAGGAVFTGFLALMNLRYAAWPLHPVGFLLANCWGLQTIWFSVFLGWVAKQAIVRMGGAGGYRASRPLFIGLIFGEAAAVAFWLCVSLVLSAMGYPYFAIQILPS